MLLSDIHIKNVVKNIVNLQDEDNALICSESNIINIAEDYNIYDINEFIKDLYTKGIVDIKIKDKEIDKINDSNTIQLGILGVSSLYNRLIIQIAIQDKEISAAGIFRITYQKTKDKGYISIEFDSKEVNNPYDIYYALNYINETSLSDILINIGINFFTDYDGEINNISKDYPYLYIIDKTTTALVEEVKRKEKVFKRELDEYNKYKEAGYTFKKIKTLDNLREKQERKIKELEDKNKKLENRLKEKAPKNAINNQLKEELEDASKEIEELDLQNKRLTLSNEKLFKEKEDLLEKYHKLELIKEEQDKLYKGVLEWISLLKLEVDTITSLDKELVEEEKTAPISLDSNSRAELERLLKNKKIVITGGHVNWQNKIKEAYPKFTYIDSDNVNFYVSVLKTADYIFFNTLHCSHTLYFKIKENMSSGRNKQDYKDKLIYINNNSVNYFTNILENLIIKQD